MNTTNTDETPMAEEMLAQIKDWLKSVQDALDKEQISYGEIAELEQLYRITKYGEQ